MKYTPKTDPENVNYSLENPVWNFFYLVTMVLAAAVVLISVVSIIGSYFFSRISPELEEKLFSKLDFFEGETAAFPEGNQLFEKLIGTNAGSYKVMVWCQDIVNAAAVPGKKILVTGKLLERLESENQLAFILGHEYGHFLNRDHLRGTGSALMIAAIFLLLGQNVEEVPFIDFTGSIIGAKFSREQESLADMTAKNLLIKIYGSSSNAAKVLDILSEEEEHFGILAPEILSSHPASPGRKQNLLDSDTANEVIAYRKYENPCKGTVPKAVIINAE